MGDAKGFTPAQWAKLARFLVLRGEPVSAPARRVLSVLAMYESMAKRVPGQEELARQADVDMRNWRSAVRELEGYRLITVTPGRGRRPSLFALRQEVIGPWMNGRLDLRSWCNMHQQSEAVDGADCTDYSRARVNAAVVVATGETGAVENDAEAVAAAAEAAPAAAAVTAEELEAAKAEIMGGEGTGPEKLARLKEWMAEHGLMGTGEPEDRAAMLEKLRQQNAREQAAWQEGLARQKADARIDETVELAVRMLKNAGVSMPQTAVEAVRKYTRAGLTEDDWRELSESIALTGIKGLRWLLPAIEERLGRGPTPLGVLDMRDYRPREPWEGPA